MKLISMFNTVNPNGFTISGLVEITIKKYSNGQWISSTISADRSSSIGDVVGELPSDTDGYNTVVFAEYGAGNLTQVTTTDTVSSILSGLTSIVIKRFVRVTFKDRNGQTGCTDNDYISWIPEDIGALRFSDIPKLVYTDSEVSSIGVDVHWTTSNDDTGTRYTVGDSVSEPLVLWSHYYYDFKPCDGTIRYIKSPKTGVDNAENTYAWDVTIDMYSSANGGWVNLSSIVSSVQAPNLITQNGLNTFALLPTDQDTEFWGLQTLNRVNTLDNSSLTNDSFEDDSSWIDEWEISSFAKFNGATGGLVVPNKWDEIRFKGNGAIKGAIVIGSTDSVYNAFAVRNSNSRIFLDFLNNSPYSKMYIVPLSKYIRSSDGASYSQKYASENDWRVVLVCSFASQTILNEYGDTVPDYNTNWSLRTLYKSVPGESGYDRDYSSWASSSDIRTTSRSRIFTGS